MLRQDVAPSNSMKYLGCSFAPIIARRPQVQEDHLHTIVGVALFCLCTARPLNATRNGRTQPHTFVTQCRSGGRFHALDTSSTARHRLGHVPFLLKEQLHNLADRGGKLFDAVGLSYGRHVDKHCPGADPERCEVDELAQEPPGIT